MSIEKQAEMLLYSLEFSKALWRAVSMIIMSTICIIEFIVYVATLFSSPPPRQGNQQRAGNTSGKERKP